MATQRRLWGAEEEGVFCEKEGETQMEEGEDTGVRLGVSRGEEGGGMVGGKENGSATAQMERSARLRRTRGASG